jgi:hypothetical protein
MQLSRSALGFILQSRDNTNYLMLRTFSCNKVPLSTGFAVTNEKHKYVVQQ